MLPQGLFEGGNGQSTKIGWTSQAFPAPPGAIQSPYWGPNSPKQACSGLIAQTQIGMYGPIGANWVARLIGFTKGAPPHIILGKTGRMVMQNAKVEKNAYQAWSKTGQNWQVWANMVAKGDQTPQIGRLS